MIKSEVTSPYYLHEASHGAIRSMESSINDLHWSQEHSLQEMTTPSNHHRYHLKVVNKRYPKQFKITDFSIRPPPSLNEKLRIPFLSKSRVSPFDPESRRRHLLSHSLSPYMQKQHQATITDFKPTGKPAGKKAGHQPTKGKAKSPLEAGGMPKTTRDLMKHLHDVDRMATNTYGMTITAGRMDNRYYDYRLLHCDMIASVKGLTDNLQQIKKKAVKPKANNYLGRFRKKIPSLSKAIVISNEIGESDNVKVEEGETGRSEQADQFEEIITGYRLTSAIGRHEVIASKQYLMKQVAIELQAKETTTNLRHRKFYLDMVKEMVGNKKNVIDFERDIKDKRLVLKNKSLYIDSYLGHQNKPVLLMELEGVLLCLAIDEHKTKSNIEVVMDKGRTIFVRLFHQVEIKPRPQVTAFLELLSKYYYLVVFSSSDARLVRQMLKAIDPSMAYFKDILTKDNCIMLKNGVRSDDPGASQRHASHLQHRTSSHPLP